jgi:ubiquinone/menaquinone biosynthesis C-methylase UbiE
MNGLLHKIAQVRNYWLGPSRKKIEEARRVLEGREYYQLFDDVYKDLSRSGGSAQRESFLEKSRRVVEEDFNEQISRRLIPPPPAKLIDLGCGEGYNAMAMARRGYDVTAVDISPTIISNAMSKAQEQHVSVDFRVGNGLDLKDFEDGIFNIATDMGCLHMLVRTEHRRQYLKMVRRVLAPRGCFFLFQCVAGRDVIVEDEELEIFRSVTLVQKRFIANNGTAIAERGCGFRHASLRQYHEELEAAGFEVLDEHSRKCPHARFAMLVVRNPA